MTTNRYATIAVVIFVSFASTWAYASPIDLDVYESFEGISPNTAPNVPFSIGPPAAEATFSGNAFAGVAGVGALYNQSVTPGVRAWMVNQASVGQIDFGVAASTVEFFARAHPGADGNTVITAFDAGNQQIGSVVNLGPVDGWTLVTFGGAVDHIQVQNLATNVLNGIDDFGYTPVPEPSAGLLALLAAAGGALALRRKHARRCRTAS